MIHGATTTNSVVEALFGLKVNLFHQIFQGRAAIETVKTFFGQFVPSPVLPTVYSAKKLRNLRYHHLQFYKEGAYLHRVLRIDDVCNLI